MAQPNGTPNTRSSSTTGGWEYRKVRRRPKGQKPSTPKASRWGRRSALNPRDRLTLEIHFRGGAECWYEVRARGEVGRFPGYVDLHQVAQEIMLGAEYHIRRP